MSLSSRLELAITELRMQMLSTEVLFGFQLQGTFREGFAHLSPLARLLDVVALTSLVVTLCALIAGPAQHRIVERGNASRRLLRVIGWLSGLALCSWALTLGCDAFMVTEYFLGRTLATVCGALAMGVAAALWLWLPLAFKTEQAGQDEPAFEATPLHEKLGQMLREAWVALPGATGLLGFQLTVTSMPDFALLPLAIQRLHFAAAALIATALVTLITPGQLHRVAYHGRDDSRAHDIGSRLLSYALAPLALGLSADYYVAVGKITGYRGGTLIASVAILLLLLTAWYAIPALIRRRLIPHHSTAQPDGTDLERSQ